MHNSCTRDDGKGPFLFDKDGEPLSSTAMTRRALPFRWGFQSCVEQPRSNYLPSRRFPVVFLVGPVGTKLDEPGF